MNQDNGIYLEEARSFLQKRFAIPPEQVTLLGEGAWSRCFGYTDEGRELAIRFGNHVDDFEKDQLAHRYGTSALPVPQVYEIGEAFDGYFAISDRVHGTSLEELDTKGWLATVPAIVEALEALRTADIADTTGWGGWGLDRQGGNESWSSRLLSVDTDVPAMRTYGWRAKLAKSAEGDATFAWGYNLLKEVARDDIPRALLHCDLINRNVLAEPGRLNGVFDWGCSIYGDHLYELAWFEFWSPWYPQHDIGYLRTMIEDRWRAQGYVPHHQEERLIAAYLHIGLDHLAYNAIIGDQENLLGTAKRMRALVPVA